MRDYRNIVFILNGSSHGNRSRTPSQAISLKQSVTEVFIHVFAAVGGDIDIFRVKFPKRIDRLI